MDEHITLNVNEFNELVDIHLKSLGYISVIGEITEKHITKNSGLIITLKDIDAKKSAILKLTGFAPRIKGINSVDVGMKVVASGIAQLYSPFGNFSLQISSIFPFGKGAIKESFEKLKLQLQKEGLFDKRRKRELPKFITKIALITADKSAALTDFIKILNETKTSLNIKFIPVSVQGKNAIDEIINAFKIINTKLKDIDAVVLTRGGGSLEDLLAFNSEEVARAIFASKYPVISAVGHERDISIADMVADIVASTPSQSAYYLANHNQNFLEQLFEINNNLYEKIKGTLTLADRKDLINTIYLQIKVLLDRYNEKQKSLESLFEAYNPKKILKKGYAVIRRNGKAINSYKLLKQNDLIDITFKDGDIKAKIK